jgi:hypothetical protein
MFVSRSPLETVYPLASWFAPCDEADRVAERDHAPQGVVGLVQVRRASLTVSERAQIMRLVLRGGMAWALTGITIGLLSAFALSRVLGSLLFEVRAPDPVTYSTVGLMLAVVAMLACGIPAARATRIDPVIALRSE